MKKIVAHIQRTVTITTVQTTMQISVSEDAMNMPAIPPQDLEAVPNYSEGESDEKASGVTSRNRPARRKPAGRLKSGRRAKRNRG